MCKGAIYLLNVLSIVTINLLTHDFHPPRSASLSNIDSLVESKGCQFLSVGLISLESLHCLFYLPVKAHNTRKSPLYLSLVFGICVGIDLVFELGSA